MQLTFREIEKAFEIDEKTMYLWLNEMALPSVKANDQYFFNSVDVLEWALKNRIPLTPGALKLCEKSTSGREIVTPAITKGGIFFGLNAANRDDALSQSLNLLPLPERLQKSTLLDMLLSREQAGTTCIGNGIAIPHVKHPVVLAGLEPVIGLFFLQRTLDFEAMDRVGVDTLFLIMSPSFKAHLALLSRLAFCLQEDSVKMVLLRRDSREEILASFNVAEAKAVRGQ